MAYHTLIASIIISTEAYHFEAAVGEHPLRITLALRLEAGRFEVS